MNQFENFMENIYKIIWSDEALFNLKSIIEYLENRWTEREIKKFVFLLDNQLRLIQINPLLFPISKISTGLRNSVLTKQVSIYYRIFENEIHLITLFDNRQNPKKLKNK